jgi:hypothetical protein
VKKKVPEEKADVFVHYGKTAVENAKEDVLEHHRTRLLKAKIE